MISLKFQLQVLPMSCNQAYYLNLKLQKMERDLARVVCKDATGFSQSHATPTPGHRQPCFLDSPTLLDNKNLEKEDSCTTKSWSPTPRRCLLPELEATLDPAMRNLPSPEPLETMSGKKILGYQERSSSLVHLRCDAMTKLTGMPFEQLLSYPIYLQYRPTYLFAVTTSCEELAKTTYSHLEWSELVMFSGVELALASRVVLGKKPVWVLTLKTPTPSFGMATEIMNTLSLMNFVELSTSPTFFDGWIAIRSSWKLKGPLSSLVPPRFGSPVTFGQKNGIH